MICKKRIGTRGQFQTSFVWFYPIFLGNGKVLFFLFMMKKSAIRLCFILK